MSTVLFLSLRTLHVLLAAAWIGATGFTSLLLMPAIIEAGRAGGRGPEGCPAGDGRAAACRRPSPSARSCSCARSWR